MVYTFTESLWELVDTKNGCFPAVEDEERQPEFSSKKAFSPYFRNGNVREIRICVCACVRE